MIQGFVCDLGLVTRFAAIDDYAHGLVWNAWHAKVTLVIPTSVLALARAQTPAGQDAIAVLLGSEITTLDDLDGRRAGEVGALLAAPDDPVELSACTETLALAHVVALSREHGWPVISDRLAALHSLDPRVEVKLLR
ncbi:hypothetical protein F0L68_41245 [Solihabitans fulvus]|uniref:PIN domain-containing protein n=1 Tax=Solihabitans fulvus TaxID=1892852 RepID=A0A5B2W3B0_9PSEU|nr:hypothetical protein [Solihabitans fulvus]KAA2245875.1 hypothetical protein F0L68_41245 [Solihabitans fulvus]